MMNGGPFMEGAAPKEESFFSPSLSEDLSGKGSPLNGSVLEYLSKLGIPIAGITFNDYGRLQLSGRLSQKFGENFMQRNEVIEAFRLFDKELDKMSEGYKSSQNEMTGMGERTLKSLLG